MALGRPTAPSNRPDAERSIRHADWRTAYTHASGTERDSVGKGRQLTMKLADDTCHYAAFKLLK